MEYFKHFLFKDFIYLFLEEGEEREKERERNINVRLPLVCPQPGTWPTTQLCALTGNQTREALVHRSTLNPLSHTSQGCAKHCLAATSDPWPHLSLRFYRVFHISACALDSLKLPLPRSACLMLAPHTFAFCTGFPLEAEASSTKRISQGTHAIMT